MPRCLPAPLPHVSAQSRRCLTDRSARLLFLSLALGALAAGCDSNPEGPRVSAGVESDKPAPTDPPLPKKGRTNPRGVQYAKPD